MHHRFERYLSKNIPQTALSTIKQKANTLAKNYNGDVACGNAYQIWNAYQQRKNVEPEKSLISENPQRIGVSHRPEISSETLGTTSYLMTEQSMNRRVRIYFGSFNHMQSTPVVSNGGWNIQLEPLGHHRSFGMQNGRCGEDPFYRWGDRHEITFANVESAISQSTHFNYGYDVIYPHERYHVQKSYADNFNFIKEAITDVEDEEAVILDVLNKLV